MAGGGSAGSNILSQITQDVILSLDFIKGA